MIIAAVVEMLIGLCDRCTRGEPFAIGEDRSHSKARRWTDPAGRSSQPEVVGAVKLQRDAATMHIGLWVKMVYIFSIID
jgi:hypothetical protein